MWVKFVKLAAGPNGCYQPGAVVFLPADVAQSYIDADAAVKTTPPKRAPETAAIESPEAAVKPAGRRKKRGRTGDPETDG